MCCRLLTCFADYGDSKGITLSSVDRLVLVSLALLSLAFLALSISWRCFKRSFTVIAPVSDFALVSAGAGAGSGAAAGLGLVAADTVLGATIGSATVSVGLGGDCTRAGLVGVGTAFGGLAVFAGGPAGGSDSAGVGAGLDETVAAAAFSTTLSSLLAGGGELSSCISARGGNDSAGMTGFRGEGVDNSVMESDADMDDTDRE